MASEKKKSGTVTKRGQEETISEMQLEVEEWQARNNMDPSSVMDHDGEPPQRMARDYANMQPLASARADDGTRRSGRGSKPNESGNNNDIHSAGHTSGDKMTEKSEPMVPQLPWEAKSSGKNEAGTPKDVVLWIPYQLVHGGVGVKTKEQAELRSYKKYRDIDIELSFYHWILLDSSHTENPMELLNNVAQAKSKAVLSMFPCDVRPAQVEEFRLVGNAILDVAEKPTMKGKVFINLERRLTPMKASWHVGLQRERSQVPFRKLVETVLGELEEIKMQLGLPQAALIRALLTEDRKRRYEEDDGEDGDDDRQKRKKPTSSRRDHYHDEDKKRYHRSESRRGRHHEA